MRRTHSLGGQAKSNVTANYVGPRRLARAAVLRAARPDDRYVGEQSTSKPGYSENTFCDGLKCSDSHCL